MSQDICQKQQRNPLASSEGSQLGTITSLQLNGEFRGKDKEDRLRPSSSLGKEVSETVHGPQAVPSREQHRSMHAAWDVDFTELDQLRRSVSKKTVNKNVRWGGEERQHAHWLPQTAEKQRRDIKTNRKMLSINRKESRQQKLPLRASKPQLYVSKSERKGCLRK